MTLVQSAHNGDWLRGTQSKEALLIVEQFPGQAEYAWKLTQNAYLMLCRGFTIPCLYNRGRFRATEGAMIEALTNLGQVCLNLLTTCDEFGVGPERVTFQVPVQVIAFLLCQWSA